MMYTKCWYRRKDRKKSDFVDKINVATVYGECLHFLVCFYHDFLFQDLEIAADFNVAVPTAELLEKLKESNHLSVSNN